MRKIFGKGIYRAMALALLCPIAFPLCAKADAGPGRGAIYCNHDKYTPYPDAVARMLPGYEVSTAENKAFIHLDKGAVAEAFDAQAVSALESGMATHWYPQYLATVVIAADRDRTDARLRGWHDLTAANEPVGFTYDQYCSNWHLMFTAMAYGLEGEGFSLGGAAKLLEELRKGGRLEPDTWQAPIVICYDYQAATLIKSGRNIEIIVPEEGTLTYQKGLLSRNALVFAEDTSALLYAEGLRLPDGRCNASLYPAASAYANASPVQDYAHLNATCLDATKVLRRRVLHKRVYSSADTREHQYFVLAYIIIVVAWTAAVIRRAMQRGVRRAALLSGTLLLGWIIVRLVKYQFIESNAFNRYLWYAFYFFQLALPLVLLWMAWAIDKPDEHIRMPGWLRLPCATNTACCMLVFTNDLHGLVFKLDPANPNWSSEYSYGIAFWFVSAAWALPLIAAIIVLVVKSGRNPRRRRFAFPLAFFVLLVLYGVGYVLRIPIAWESDYTMMTGLFTLLFVEACFSTGMIPINSKYATLFAHSPLNMQIVDTAGNTAFASANTMHTDPDIRRGELAARALATHPLPVEKDNDTLLFAAPIPGGAALWQEDISALNHLQAEMENSVRKLAAANAVLSEQRRVRQAIDEESAQAELTAQLEIEIAAHTERLAEMVTRSASNRQESARIVLLLCYVKRRCNLFFRGLEVGDIPAGECVAYMDELAEIAGYTGVEILLASGLEAPVEVRMAALLYEFFYAVVDWAALHDCQHMLARLTEEDGLSLQLLPSVDARSFALNNELAAAVAAAGGAFAVKDLDGAAGISLLLGGGSDG